MLDPSTEFAKIHVEQFDPFSNRNDVWGRPNFGAAATRTARNYETYWSYHGEGLQFRPLNAENESGIHSPPLWTTSPQRSPVHPRHHTTNYGSLSPTSRTQAIAKGQRELMEMVKNMPETSFELSLKDIVEHHSGETQEECLLKEQNYDDDRVGVHQRVNFIKQEGKNSEKKAKMVRNESMENRGLLLNMVFPVSLKSKKKKNMMNNMNSTSSKVSPKPEISDRTNSRGVDKDWWKKRFSVSGDQSESSRSSSNSGSTGSSGSGSGSSSSHSSGGSSTRSGGSRRKKSSIVTKCFPRF